MTRSRVFPVNVPHDARVLVCFRVEAAEIPQDKLGRFVLQLQSRAIGGGAKPGKVIFGGEMNPTQTKAQVSISPLLHAGFRVNNIGMVNVYDKKGDPRDDVYQVRVWFNRVETSSDRTLEDEWSDAGAFVRAKLALGYNRVTVFDNGDMLSINMTDAMKKEAEFLLSPRVAPPDGAATSDTRESNVPAVAMVRTPPKNTPQPVSVMQYALMQAGLK